MCWLRLVRNAGRWLGLGDDNAWNAGKNRVCGYRICAQQQKEGSLRKE
jgi:hypothetical protein